jgi:single-stranded DNA-binding protein
MRDPLDLRIPTFSGSDRLCQAVMPTIVHNGSGLATKIRKHDHDAIALGTAPTHRAAARGYNHLVFEGRLAEDPLLRQAGTGRLYCRVAVLQDQPDRNGQPGAQGVDVVCFDERATRFAERFRRGDYAIFIGRMAIERRRDQKGQVHMNVSLHLERVLGHRPVRRGA